MQRVSVLGSESLGRLSRSNGPSGSQKETDREERSLIHSFDVFDTLITRVWFKPTDLFLGVAAELKEFGLFTGTPDEWLATRVAAEHNCLKRQGKNEVTLDEIFAHLATECGWTPRQERRAKNIELKHELRGSRPIASVVSRLQDLRNDQKTTIFVSDTYFGNAALRRILLRCGVTCDGEQLFCSSSHDATKRDGGLYDVVAAHLGTERERISHLGDNVRSDYLMAQKRGVQSAMFSEGAPSLYENAIYRSRSGSQMVRSAIAGCARTARLSEHAIDDHERAIWQISSNVAGPLLTGFVLWTLLQARNEGRKTVYFLARDGQILERIASKLVTWLRWPIECKYLLASRKALFLPSLASQPEQLLSRVLERDESKAIASASALIGCDLRALADRLDPGKAKSASDVRELLSICEPELVAISTRQREALHRYLIQEGFGEADAKPVLVDIGWHGNLQLHLDRAIAGQDELRAAASDMMGLYFGLAKTPAAIADRVSTFAPYKTWLNASLLETFCAADHGTVLEYQTLPNGGATAVLAAEKNTSVLDWGLETQQRGISTFVDHLTTGHRAAGFDVAQLLDGLRATGLKNLRQLVTRPSLTEARCYGSVRHAVDAGHLTFEEIAPQYTAGRAAHTILRGARNGGGLWPEGSLARRSTTTIERHALLSLWSLRGTVAGFARGA